MTLRRYVKDPDAVKDYGIDWSEWLDGDTIDASVWIAEVGITVDSDGFTATKTTVVLSGGTDGAEYRVTNRVTTVAGLVDDRTLLVSVREQ